MEVEGADFGASSAPTASFMGLPAELRLRIYEHLFSESPQPEIRHSCWHTVTHGLSDPRVIRCSCWSRLCTQLLKTCRQIRKEATPVLYNSIQFRVRTAVDYGEHDFRGVADALSVLLATQIPHIRKLHLVADALYHINHMPRHVYGECLSQLQNTLPALHAVKMSLSIKFWSYSLRTFEGCDHWAEDMATLVFFPKIKLLEFEAFVCQHESLKPMELEQQIQIATTLSQLTEKKCKTNAASRRREVKLIFNIVTPDITREIDD